MKSKPLLALAITVLLLFLGFMLLREGQLNPQVYAATINRDCAPWDGAAFTVSIRYDLRTALEVSIWKSPQIYPPAVFSFPDGSGRIGNAIQRFQSGQAEPLNGTLFFRRLGPGMPAEGGFNFISAQGIRFDGKFKAEWGTQAALCG